MTKFGLFVRSFRVPERRLHPYSNAGRFAAREPFKTTRWAISLTTPLLLASVRSWCSQILNVEIPFAFSNRLTPRARSLFPSIFERQYLRFVFGSRRHRGHPCQKHPSTKTATRRFGNQKSGCPTMSRGCICQPLMPRRTRSSLNRLSVEKLPVDRTFDIRTLRWCFVSVSICPNDKNL